MRRRRLDVAVESWPLRRAFRTAGTLSSEETVITVTLAEQECEGRGEASGVYYRGETAQRMVAAIEAVRGAIEAGMTRGQLASTLPPGGARNAVDCAMWGLEARLAGQPAWQLAGLAPPRPLVTTVTLGADEPEMMAQAAGEHADFSALKIKLLGDDADVWRVAAVRSARPDAWLAVDANQSLGREGLERLMPALVEAGIAMVEQPVTAGAEHMLEGFDSPIPLAADESIAGEEDLDRLRRHYRVLNIKLDKTGGLTAALALARKARAMGFELMVGNMVGTSLAMAPAFLVGQFCEVVDLDGPLLLGRDRAEAARYSGGRIACAPAVWA